MESEDSVSNDSFKSGQESTKAKSSSRESSPSTHSIKNEEPCAINEAERSESPNSQDSIKAENNDCNPEKETLNISHEDLSDVSDLESGQSFEDKKAKPGLKDLREKLDERKNYLKGLEKSNGYSNIEEKKTDEDVLDFEAEEGECNEGKDDTDINKVRKE